MPYQVTLFYLVVTCDGCDHSNSKFVIDGFHQENHTACSPFFDIVWWPQYSHINTAQQEQANGLMRMGDLVPSVSYMKQSNFMLTMREWQYYYNTRPV
jgi:hypothetical protein